ncbi:hypothetical protein SteCoe_8069 [Stentor coeruleus]|uniref:Actin n=1 Tax=Stentor coeruleus TaxID=5963 RepID=A0A1R2CL60_9CILI|nr:hypothetical protein SteCoe_8069 [Stentor coeruleus]
MEKHKKPPLIIDSGSSTIKAGLAGDKIPSLTIPSFVGRAKFPHTLKKRTSDTYVGFEAERNISQLKLRYPISRGKVENWADVEELWKYVYSALSLTTNAQPVIISETSFNPCENREKTAEIFFETFNVPGMLLASQGILSLYSTGSTTGVILDCGEGTTQITPIYEGFSIAQAITRMDLAGKDLTEHLIRLLMRSGYSISSSHDIELARTIKEQKCYVSPAKIDMNSPLEKALPESFTMPDGRIIPLANERYLAAEILFTPDRLGLELPGISQLLINSVQNTAIDLRKNLYSKIYVTGGTTLMTGFGQRLLGDIKKASPKDVKVKMVLANNRINACWLGASVLSSTSEFGNSVISRRRYEEEGNRIFYTWPF